MLKRRQSWKMTLSVILLLFFLGSVTSAEPLNEAAKQGNLKEVKRLISKGANIEAKDASSATPLYNAVDKGNKDVVEFLILKGADLNANCTDGFTPLHLATVLFGGDKEMVKLLLSHGANVNAIDRNNDTPLHLAAFDNLVEIAEILIANGAD